MKAKQSEGQMDLLGWGQRVDAAFDKMAAPHCPRCGQELEKNGQCYCGARPVLSQNKHTFANEEPLARNNDLSSSHQAADYLTTTGKRNEQKAKTLNAVVNHPGLTSRELADATGIENEILHKRLPDLHRDGLLTKGDIRECKITGRQAVTWYMK